jgi:hypothetical protein
MGALAVAMATEDNERDAQYKLSLSRSKLRPRTEKGRSAANPHLCARMRESKEKKNYHDAQKKKKKKNNNNNNNNNNSLPFFLSANWISRSLSEIDQTNAIPLPKSKQIIV